MNLRTAAAAIVIAAGVSFMTSPALAQDEWKEEGGDGKPPPDDHGAKKKEKEKEEAPPDADAKPSRFVVDLKLGPAFVLSAKGVTEFGLQLNAGYALSHDLITKGDALYLTVSPYLIVGDDLTLVAPLGVQYDLPLTVIPYKGIYAYARVSAGYAFRQFKGIAFDQGDHGFAVQPALGAKLNFFDRFHVGIEPFAFDIVHTLPHNKTAVEQTLSAFQLYIFVGANF